MESGVLLDVTQLLEPSVAVGALVWLFASVDPDVLDQLVVAAERLEALLALVRLDLAAAGELAGVHLHRRLVHEDLKKAMVLNLSRFGGGEAESLLGGCCQGQDAPTREGVMWSG